MDRIMFQGSHNGMGIGNPGSTVVVHNTGPGGDSRHNAFTAAGKARKEVRFDKSFCDQQIGLVSQFVNGNGISAGSSAMDSRSSQS